jgi:hypothetical protein
MSSSPNENAPRPVRRSALVAPWGVGAIVDYPNDESLMTAGLDAWPFAWEDCPTDWQVDEERLQSRLGVNHLRLPPDYRKTNEGARADLRWKDVPAVRFPRWHFCPYCGTMEFLGAGGTSEHCRGYDWGQKHVCGRSGKKAPRLIPSRFVAICPAHGHIQDFPFMEWVHRHTPATSTCKLRFKGGMTGVSLGAIRVECACGQSESLTNALRPDALTKLGIVCGGVRPWLGETDGNSAGCGEVLSVVQRTASNVYFAHVASSIYLPLWGEGERASVVEALEDRFNWRILTTALVEGKIDLEMCKAVSERCHGDFTSEELQRAAQKKLEGSLTIRQANTHATTTHGREELFRQDEYAAMRTGRTVQPELEMQRRDGNDYGKWISEFFQTITLVRKLRETRALYGFSRGVPDDGRSPGEMICELRLNPELDWLPANYNKGEGVFFGLAEEPLNDWLVRPVVRPRLNGLIENYNRVLASRGRPRRVLAPKFIALHTLAHLLINQLAFDCGYGASSLRERIYCDGEFPEMPMNGFLIYTAEGDADGTLGGLVRQGEPGSIEKIMDRALRRARWCSYDPLCLESKGQGPESCNLAACHSCAMLPETSCEENNKLLDRAALVGLPEVPELGLFGLSLFEKWSEA